MPSLSLGTGRSFWPFVDVLTHWLGAAVTARDELWPFFLFWRHHFWPKLASSILNFCRRKDLSQWGTDQSDRLNGALDTHKNAQKVEWKLGSKISCHYTWMLHAKNFPSRWRFLRSFLTASKPSRRSITAAKAKKRRKKKGEKKFQKSKSLKDVESLWFLRMPESQCTKNAMQVSSKLLYCERIFDRIKGNLARSSLKIIKMS